MEVFEPVLGGSEVSVRVSDGFLLSTGVVSLELEGLRLLAFCSGGK